MPHVDEGTLHSLLDGELAPAEVLEVQTHFATCPDCAARLDEARQLLAETERLVSALESVGQGAGRSAGGIPPAAASAGAPSPAPPRPPSQPAGEAPAGRPLIPLDPVVLIPNNPTVTEVRRSRLRIMAWAATFLMVVGAGAVGLEMQRGLLSGKSKGTLKIRPEDFSTAPGVMPAQDSEAMALEAGRSAPPMSKASPLDVVTPSAPPATPAPGSVTPPAAKQPAPQQAAPGPTPPAPAPRQAKSAPAPAAPSKQLADQPAKAAQTSNQAAGAPARAAEALGQADDKPDVPAIEDRDSLAARAAKATADLDREHMRARAAVATAALDAERKAAAAPPSASPTPVHQLPPRVPTLEQQAQLSSRIGLDEAARQLGGPLHAIDGMTRQLVGLVSPNLVPGADTTRPVVRAVYVDRGGRMVYLDQQRVRPGQRDLPFTPQTGRNGEQHWMSGAVMLVLRGDLSADSLRALSRRVR